MADVSPYAELAKSKLKGCDEIRAVYGKILYCQRCIEVSNIFNFPNAEYSMLNNMSVSEDKSNGYNQ